MTDHQAEERKFWPTAGAPVPTLGMSAFGHPSAEESGIPDVRMRCADGHLFFAPGQLADIAVCPHCFCREVSPEPLTVVGAEDADFPKVAGGWRDTYPQAVAFVVHHENAAVTFVQRKLKLTYDDAKAIIDRMVSEGILGKSNTAGHRTIYLSKGRDWLKNWSEGEGENKIKPDPEGDAMAAHIPGLGRVDIAFACPNCGATYPTARVCVACQAWGTGYQTVRVSPTDDGRNLNIETATGAALDAFGEQCPRAHMEPDAEYRERLKGAMDPEARALRMAEAMVAAMLGPQVWPALSSSVRMVWVAMAKAAEAAR